MIFSGGWNRIYCPNPLLKGDDCSPSSRNVAFIREGWAAVGGYPEWLTLTAEDSLYNRNLHYAGYRFYHQPTAIVRWEGRQNLKAYLKMMHTYGFGSAEAGQSTDQYVKCLLTTIVPPFDFHFTAPSHRCMVSLPA